MILLFVTYFHSPIDKSFADIFPTRPLTNLKQGKPTAAHILLTCLFFPSVRITSIQVVGIDFLDLIGGSRSGILKSLRILTTAGLVV
jgi:hypothetical protein